MEGQVIPLKFLKEKVPAKILVGVVAIAPCIPSSDGPVRRKLFSMRRVAPDKVFYCG